MHSSVSNNGFGTLYFIPVTMGADNVSLVLPTDVIGIAQGLDEFIVENEKTARHFLGVIRHKKPIRDIILKPLNKHTDDRDIPKLLSTLIAGRDVGLMSEAGCPGIADPGAKIAALAHKKGIRVAPLVGPSSILLSLMASGLNGQRFTFVGYLPSDKSARVQEIKLLEQHAKAKNETQIFIETPFRNQHMLTDILSHCKDDTLLCIACNVTLPDEFIVTKPISRWKQESQPDLHKKPTIFLLLA